MEKFIDGLSGPIADLYRAALKPQPAPKRVKRKRMRNKRIDHTDRSK